MKIQENNFPAKQHCVCLRLSGNGEETKILHQAVAMMELVGLLR
jgi:hypothetical protein